MEPYIRDLVVVLLLRFLFSSVPTELGRCDGYSPEPLLCKEQERRALVRFKESIHDPSNTLSSWAGDECCNWKGVGCHNTTGHVHKLKLQPEFRGIGTLGGEISSSLLELKHLRYLDLSHNDFGGRNIPEFLGSISSLRYLNLSRAGFGSVIPPQLGNLSKLQYLDIGYNFDYPWENVPCEDLQWIAGLTSLVFLDMGYANLSRASNWLQVMNKLPSLSVLLLSSCDLYTVDPLSHVNFSSLAILDLAVNHLISSSLDSFANLNSLVTLDLSFNGIQGPIPLCLQNLTSLTFLRLDYNRFTSFIPDWLTDITTLEYLNLAQNNLEGKIPKDIGNLTSITYLDLSYNELEGKIPKAIGNLTSITYLDLSYNNLEGDILKSLANICVFQLSNLWHHIPGKYFKILRLVENKFTGPFPEALGQCKGLETLDLRVNHFSGQIPVSLGGMSSLSYLNMRENFFKGVISERHLANLTSLVDLDASSNSQLSLRVGSNWTPPFQLTNLGLGSCLIGPQFPEWLQTQKNLPSLNMSYAGISGAIPAWFWTLPYDNVDLSHNQINGNIPSIPFKYAYLSSNGFTDPLPQLTSHVVLLDLSNNRFRGSLSPMLCRGGSNVYPLTYLEVSGNFLSGELPDCWMYWAWLMVIKLDNNKLSGGIPSSMGSLPRLASLHLRNNQLSGILLPSLQNCTNLQVVDLSHNEFSGIIPRWIGNLTGALTGELDSQAHPGLWVLVLHSNKFSGDIPMELCKLNHSLQILDLAHNRLSGTIPPCFGSFTSMAAPQDQKHEFMYWINVSSYPFADTTLLVMKSLEFKYNSKILDILAGIDLSCNNLSGEIPRELTNLRGLIFMNLSNNHLQGKIPSEVGAMISLESLDLSVNNLSGVIPQSLTSMSFLSQLNLSYNKLSGRIPSGTQIQGFEQSSFIGNDGLCGPPLTYACPGDAAPPSQTSGNANKDEDEDEWMEMKWFYPSLPLGFVVGFWVVLGPLLLNRCWRHAYFKFLNDMKCRLLGWM